MRVLNSRRGTDTVSNDRVAGANAVVTLTGYDSSGFAPYRAFVEEPGGAVRRHSGSWRPGHRRGDPQHPPHAAALAVSGRQVGDSRLIGG